MSEPGWDQSKFDSLLALTLVATKRSAADCINTAAYMVARKAIWFTQKADKSSIEELRSSRKVNSRYDLSGKHIEGGMTTLAELIINARLYKKGMLGIYGAQLIKAASRMISARKKSIAFIKSGWIPARDALKPLAVVKGGTSPPPDDSDAQKSSGIKGRATLANPTADLIFAIIENATVAKHDRANSLQKYGAPGLQKAFDDESAQMMKYLESHWTEKTSELAAKLAEH